jgi:hypothetical protein
LDLQEQEELPEQLDQRVVLRLPPEQDLEQKVIKEQLEHRDRQDLLVEKMNSRIMLVHTTLVPYTTPPEELRDQIM